MIMRKRTLARECALKLLYQADLNHHSLDEMLLDFWKWNPVSADIREFAEQLVRGTFEHMKAIDEKIVQYTENWELRRMAAVDRNILRFSVYELIYLEQIPHKVTINEAVNIAKKYSQEDAGKFVNGVLDKITHSEGIDRKDERVESEGKK
jgi:transcription antitermination factor NusB